MKLKIVVTEFAFDESDEDSFMRKRTRQYCRLLAKAVSVGPNVPPGETKLEMIISKPATKLSTALLAMLR